MPKLKRLSGDEVIKIFKNFNFEVNSQKGSHIKLRRIQNNQSETLIIPNHKEIDTGTLRAIIRQASRYINLTELEPFFYN
jgi:predicted RNA binding protein YcfA (HicA-like mRNA interferase family)